MFNFIDKWTYNVLRMLSTNFIFRYKWPFQMYTYNFRCIVNILSASYLAIFISALSILSVDCVIVVAKYDVVPSDNKFRIDILSHRMTHPLHLDHNHHEYVYQ